MLKVLVSKSAVEQSLFLVVLIEVRIRYCSRTAPFCVNRKELNDSTANFFLGMAENLAGFEPRDCQMGDSALKIRTG
jgi:hypothetical protein